MGRLAVALVASLFVMVPAAQAAQRSDGSVPAPAQITSLVTSVPASTLNRVGAGGGRNPITSPVFGISKGHSHLTSDGKPEIVDVALAWCPHCAANSWALAVALSRFGTLTGLGEVNTGTYFCNVAEDPCNLNPLSCFPYTHGLSFFHAVYRSPYISFASIVLQDVNGRNLQKPTRREEHSLSTVHLARTSPALDFAGAWGFGGSGYNPGVLAHMSWSQIAGSLAKPHNPVARKVDGLANLFSAAICRVTKDRPRSVCSSAGVRAAADAVLRKFPAGPPPPP
ncbi:MAG: DUF929 family protein [Solirubrobacterales bacterium]|nr:DUF929 family protein [Solirubrobacterales bacterium]